MRQYVCRVCEGHDLDPMVCYCKTEYEPVGCLHVAKDNDPIPQDTMPCWLPLVGPVDVHQESLGAWS
jgi:hypothetical protein